MAEPTFDNTLYNGDPNIKRSDFPQDFMFGVGTSAYQSEGAWNKDGKGLHIWDCFALRHPENILDGSNACVTIDSYNKMKEDVQLLKKMGVNSFRFSISWSRILPGGKVSMGKNLEGINYYNKLIDELKANDIEPFVTLYHWDLPNALEEEYMGFLSSKIVDDFVNYAEICFWEFGDRVKNWVTFNEAHQFTANGYASGLTAPGRGGTNEDGDPETEPYTVAYNILNSHAAAYRKYQEDYKDVQKGQVGITLDATFFKPFRGEENADDVKAVEYAYDFQFGWFMEPLTSGNWPKNMLRFATLPSQNHPEGRSLPTFSDEQKKLLVKSYDFLGINYYTASYAQIDNSQSISDGYNADGHFTTTAQDPNGNYIGEPAYDGAWIYLCANELFDLLNLIKKTYNVEKHIVITENGAPQKNEDGKTYIEVRDDAFRLKYMKWHLEVIKKANEVLSIPGEFSKPLVMGYFAWSFTDSYEWASGYTARFGMNYVDFKNGLHRYPKNSAIWYKKFLSEDIILVETRKRKLTNVEQQDEAKATQANAKLSIVEAQKLKKAKSMIGNKIGE